MPFLQQSQTASVVIPAGQSICIGALRGAKSQILIPSGLPGGPIGLVSDSQTVYGPYPTGTTVQVQSLAGETEYVVGLTPVLTDTTFNPAAVVATAALRVIVAGAGTVLTNPNIQATNSVNGFTQIANQNKATGASASADMIAYPDNNANDTTGFVDIGVCSSTFADAAYTITGANDAYLFGSAVSGAGKAGNLVLCTDSTGSSNDIVFGTGGFLTANEKMRLKGAGALRLVPLAAAPVTNVQEGDIYYNSTLHKLQVRTASAWETITSV